MNRTARSLMVVSILGCPSVLLAQSDASKPTEAVLSGPKVEAKAQARTLIERDETGRVRRLDIPPAEAALKLLDLDDATKEKTQAILDKRAAILDRIVKENLLLLVELSNATRSGDKEAARDLLRELAEKAEPLRTRGQLQEELSRVLPAEKSAELKQLVQEYARAIFADAEQARSSESMEGEGAGERRSRRGAMSKAAQAEYVAAVGRELKRSYDRVVTAAVQDFDELIKALDLTPEQEAEVRRIATDHFQKTAGNPTPKQKGEVFAQVYAKLNAEQRRALLKRARGEKPE